MKQSVIIEMISFLLILLFAYAGISKLLDYRQFGDQLKEMPLSRFLSGMLVWLIPATEGVIVGMLVIPPARLAGFYASLGILAVFTLYIGVLLLSHISLPCSCGGVIQGFSWEQHLVFNGFFLALSVTGVILQTRQKKGIK
jgi:hypothetical protein